MLKSRPKFNYALGEPNILVECVWAELHADLTQAIQIRCNMDMKIDDTDWLVI